MMQSEVYRVGDKVICLKETRRNGSKYILSHNPDPEIPFEEVVVEIAIIFYEYGDIGPYYSVIVPNDCVGWIMSYSHGKVDSRHIGKKFWDVTEDFIIRKVKA